MAQRTVLMALIGIISGLAAFTFYQRMGWIPALLVFTGLAVLLFRFSSLEQAWNTMGWFIDPMKMLFIGLFLGAGYWLFEMRPFDHSLVFGFGAMFLAIATGMVLHKYWNIGG